MPGIIPVILNNVSTVDKIREFIFNGFVKMAGPLFLVFMIVAMIFFDSCRYKTYKEATEDSRGNPDPFMKKLYAVVFVLWIVWRVLRGF